MSDERYSPKSKGREGPFPGDNRGPRERFAALPEPPPLFCPRGCGLDLSKYSHDYGPGNPCPPAIAASSGPTFHDKGNVVQMKLNGYRWPDHLVPYKANGSK